MTLINVFESVIHQATQQFSRFLSRRETHIDVDATATHLMLILDPVNVTVKGCQELSQMIQTITMKDLICDPKNRLLTKILKSPEMIEILKVVRILHNRKRRRNFLALIPLMTPRA